MSENERIIANINASMDMEGMPLTVEDKNRLISCLSGEISFDDAVDSVIKEFKRRKAV